MKHIDILAVSGYVNGLPIWERVLAIILSALALVYLAKLLYDTKK